MRKLLHWILNFFLHIFMCIPLSDMIEIADIFGYFAYYFFHKRTKTALKNLKFSSIHECYPGKFKKIVMRMWQNLSRNLLEFIYLHKHTRKDINRTVYWDKFDKLLELKQKQRGVLALTAHLGNWDILALSCGLKGVTVNLVTKRLRSRFWDQFWQNWRKGKGSELVNPIFKKGAAKQIVQKLRAGELVAFVLDQHAKRKEGGIVVNFFGRKASTLNILASLSKKHKIPVLPVFTVRTSRTKHKVFVEEPLYFEETTSPEDSLKYNTQRYSDIMEKYIRKYPEQWTWLHRRWKAAERE
ncbi:MAG: lysophospholipid acyltransferase family protein [Planctomycetota bacterium]